MAIQLVQKDNVNTIGCAFVNTSLRRISVCEFFDNDQFSNLEAAIVQIGAKEALMYQEPDSYAHNKIVDVLKRSDVVLSDAKKSHFKTDTIEQDLSRLLKSSIKNFLEILEKKHVMGAVACLIHYLDMMGDQNNYGYYDLATFDLDQFMKLDSSAVKALNLVPQPTDTNKSMNLFGLLNHCRTGMGSRRLMQWIRQPLLNIELINQRHDLVSVFIEDTVLRKTIQDEHFKKIPDLDRLIKRFQKVRANLEDLVKLYQFVVRIPDIQKCLSTFEGEEHIKTLLDEKYTDNFTCVIEDFQRFEDLVETTIDLKAAQNNEYLINADIDQELKELKIERDSIQSEIESTYERINKQFNIDAKLEKNKQLGYHMQISSKDEKNMRGGSNYISLGTIQSKVKFTTSELQELSNEYKITSEKYDAKQSSLVEQCIKIAASFIPVMEIVSELVAEMDILISFAHQSLNAQKPYTRPIMQSHKDTSKVAKMELLEARHPCLESQDIVLNNVSVSGFIPNDVKMIQGKSDFVIITGPNMGGKSTFIRMIGVVALMAQIGCYVPCNEGSTVTTRDCILARVGASDSQFRGISTFMAEMLETATILQNATQDSLIIIDELGRGTSTFDGFGLAWAISEHIITDKKSMTVFATHFHELTAIGDEDVYPNVCNMHVVAEARENSITMLYKLAQGPCEKSFGIHVAQLAKFPDQVVQVAKRKVEELENAEESEGDPKRIRHDEEVMRDALREFCLIKQDEHMNEKLQALKQKIQDAASSDATLKSTLDKIKV
ncbi:DNA mismatch repair protein Msh2 [Acrasis kona]|uniref:DNA mismatch repair protein MSH2 n=1 Tax=Acrasis kona TaxID=1008807 RepID=A0AAW2YUS4_9EUKA